MRRRSSLPTLALLLAAACAPTPVKLEVEPKRLVLSALGETAVLSVTLRDKKQQPIPEPRCTFVSTRPDVVEVRADGTVLARAAGHAQVEVACKELRSSAVVEVNLPNVLNLEPVCTGRCKLEPGNPPTFKLDGIGASARLPVRVLDQDDKPVAVEVRYEVLDPSLDQRKRPPAIAVTQAGEIRALAPGSALLVVQAGTLTEKANVEVFSPAVDVVRAPATLSLRPGARASLRAAAFKRTKGGLKPVSGARLTYQSDAPSVVSVDAAGVVTAHANGAAEVLAAADSGAFAQVRVSVGVQREKRPAKKRRR